MDNGATHSTATLLFSFLLSFLGLSCASILGGLVWQRFSARWRGHPDEHPDTLKGPPVPPSRPRMWDVCIRDTLSAAKLSDCAWEQLRPLALHLTSAADSKGGVAEESRPAKWKLSPFGRNELEFQTHRNISDAAEEEIFLDGCQASIAVVIAYPTRPIKAEVDEFALGTAHTLCSGPWAGRDTLWISHT
ncbi:hypothetical protein VTO73DRAFT_10653 [Trametes versicolor]